MKRLLLLLFPSGDNRAGPGHPGNGGPNGAKVLTFERMAPVVPPFTGATNPIRCINGGGVPWALTSVEGQLRADGRLRIEVVGLIIPARGMNPATTGTG
jgi:hypothetical protein